MLPTPESPVEPLVTSPARRAVLQHVARTLLGRAGDRPLRVAIDGIDGAGKTTFADEVAALLDDCGRQIVRASVDGFHHPRSVRYVRGKGSPEGFFRDSYDYAALRRVLLDPLGPGGDRRVRRAVFDVDADTPVDAPEERVSDDAILLLDGIFLHRPELRACWDASVFLRVEWPRNHHLRKLMREHGRVDPEKGRFRRYHGGQDLYFRECAPWTHADVVVDNDDLATPYVVTPTTQGR